MKKLIAFFFVGCIYLAASNVWGEELYNYGKLWTSWSDYERHVYLCGYKNGIEEGVSKLLNSHGGATRVFSLLNEGEDAPGLRNEKSLEILIEIFQPFGTEGEINVIRDVMTNLYSHRLNAYITFPMMVDIAKKKLAGDKVEDDLRIARGYQKKVNKLVREIEDNN